MNEKKRRGYSNLIKVRNQILTQTRVLNSIQLGEVKPQWLILQCLPILPPDLRPVVHLEERKILTADINVLYQQVIRRNTLVAEIRRKIKIYQKSDYYERLLKERMNSMQESLNCLFENTTIKRIEKKHIYKSLSDILKGKRGRFRQNLLGIRVDYSRRSVIISGPELAIHQCGLPYKITVVLFQPFFIRFLVGRNQNGKYIQTRFQARKFIEQKIDERWNRRKHILYELPVLLNRAPTLHRFGFQAFQPQLIKKQSIQIYPLSCNGYNADFDGDQIAVHVPLFPFSRTEA